MFLEENKFTYTIYNDDQYQFVTQKMHDKSEPEVISKPIDCHAYSIEFIGSQTPVFEPLERNEHYYNFFIGEDRAKWASKVRHYAGVKYNDIYPGIDLKAYSEYGGLKYDWLVDANADPSQIKWTANGTDKIEIDQNGDLIIYTSVGEVVEQHPYTYQLINGQEIEIDCEYLMNGDEFSFKIGEYDPDYPLVIDPKVIFSTFSGSFADNFGYTATFDDAGFLYAAGSAFGKPAEDYPVTTGAYQTVFGGGSCDVGVSKYDKNGAFMVYSTYLGGNGSELPHSIIVNSKRELVIFGTTSSQDFPTTTSAYDTSFNGGDTLLSMAPGDPLIGLGVNYYGGSDIFISRLSTSGASLEASTLVGGTDNDGMNTTSDLRFNYADQVRGEVLVDDQDNVYVVSCTNSNDFPVSNSSFQNSFGGQLDGVVFKMDNNLTTMQWSSFIGGSSNDAVYSITFDSNGDLVIAGGTSSNNFNIVSTIVNDGVFIEKNYIGGSADGFVSRITNNGVTLTKSVYYGSGQYDQVYFVELDDDDNVYLLGQTRANDSTMIFNALYSQFNSGQFISKLDPVLNNVTWSTVFGRGSGDIDISPTAFLVDLCNKVYVSGWGGALNSNLGKSANSTTNGLDVTTGSYQTTTGGHDFYLMVLEDDASSLAYATFFGGATSTDHVDGGTSRFDRKGIVYQSVCAGCGNVQDFPIEPSPEL